MLVQVVSRVPYLRMFFNARHCRFLRLGNLYMQSGEEARLVRLIEAVLARQKVNSAITFQDPRSPFYKKIAQRGRYGLLNSKVYALIHVMATLKNFSKVQRERCKQLPLFISPVDIG